MLNVEAIKEEIQQSRNKISELDLDLRKQFRKEYPNWSVVEEYAPEISSLASHIRYLQTLKSKYK